MQQLSKAIAAQYDANAALKAALTYGLWDTEAPQLTAYPYGVFQLVSHHDDLTFTDTLENCMVQFKIYHKSSSSVTLDAILKLLLAAFDFATLTIDDYTFVAMHKENIIQNKIDGVWEYLILFRVMLTIDRP